MWSLRRFALVLSPASLVACAGSFAEGELDGPEPVSSVSYALGTVDDAVANGCSTTSVKGLSEQIVAQLNCLIPDALATVPDRPNMSKGAATFPFLQPPAADGLVLALDAHPGTQMSVNSMLRTVAQQYLLYRWANLGQCGISVAASPGNSNHESGLAFDIDQYSTWRSALESRGFQWYGSADPWHFTYVGPGRVDLQGKDVLAFQQLWNLNNPNDLIATDGAYGPQTEARLRASPAAGFAVVPTCGAPPPPAGYIDSAGCEFVSGWAYNPDEPGQTLQVQVSFGGPVGDPAATTVTTAADQHRDDLCAALGSCAHGFALPSPLSLHDGSPHPVHAYGVGPDGKTELDESPRILQCTPSIPPSVRRHVPDQNVMSAWNFSAFWHLLPITAGQLDAIEVGSDIEPGPILLKADDAPEVWLIDRGFRRHVPNPEVAAAWSLDLGTTQVVSSAEVDVYPVGTVVRARPVLVKAEEPAIYLLDDNQNVDVGDAATADTGPGPGSEAGGDSNDGFEAGLTPIRPDATAPESEETGGCSCELASRTHGSGAWGLIYVIALLGRGRRVARRG